MRRLWLTLGVIVTVGAAKADDPLREQLESSSPSLTFEQQHPQSADCQYGAFRPRSYPLGLIAILAAERLSDSYNQHMQTIMARCVDASGDVVNVCGTAARMNTTGYVSDVTMFAGRFDAYAKPPTVTGFKTGAAAKKLCDAVMRE